jgi:type I restriction enzyme, S subunit
MVVESLFGDLPEIWETTTLGEICQRGNGFIQTGPFGSQLHAADYVEQGIPSIMPQNIGDNQVIEDGISRITQQDAKRLSRYRVQTGDIVYSRRGDVTRRALIRDEQNGWLCGTGSLMIRLGKGIADPKFVSYFLGDLRIREWILRHAVGATMPNLNTSIMAAVPIFIPPLSEQRAIAGILGTLDDKIELNRSMNRTLESMARSIFRESIKDVEEQGSILEFADLMSGGTPSTAEERYWNGNVEWVSAKDVSNANGVFLLDTEKKISQEGIDNSATKLLPVKTVIVTARGTVGAHCMLGKPMTMNQTSYGLKAKEGIGNYFVYFTLSEMVEQLKQQSYGTIFDTITTKTFQNALCAQPSDGVIQSIEKQITPMMDTILNNQKESRTLESLRDSLLPKLMMGEIRVHSQT